MFYARIKALFTRVTALEAAGGGGWFAGAERDEVSAEVPATTSQEQHRLTIPAGVNKLIGIRAWSLAVDNSANLGGQLTTYLGSAYRASDGVLYVQPGPNFSAGSFPGGQTNPGVCQVKLDDATALLIDGDDLVINAANNGGATGTIRSLVEWVVIDSPTPITPPGP